MMKRNSNNNHDHDLAINLKSITFLEDEIELEYEQYLHAHFLSKVNLFVKLNALIFPLWGVLWLVTASGDIHQQIKGCSLIVLTLLLSLSKLFHWRGELMRKSGKRSLVGIRTEAFAVVVVIFYDLVIMFAWESETYLSPSQCCAEDENSIACGPCQDLWFNYILTYSLMPVILFVVVTWLGVLRFRAQKNLIFFITLTHAVRTVFLAPVPPALMGLWVSTFQFSLPVVFYLMARGSELAKRKLFVFQRNLQKELGEAQRALKFDAPTSEEREVVADVLNKNQALQGAAQIRFEDLDLHERIATGSFGEVIKATYMGVHVAVKRLLRSRIGEKKYMIMFRDEILLVRGLNHPNIVQFVGASWDSVANICIVLEYIEKGALTTVLTDRSLSLSWSDPKLKMLLDVVCGLLYLHTRHRPIIHRDIKPDNVLVTKTFSCKLTDFGASRAKQADDGSMTMTGTLVYMAPEVLCGYSYNQSADVYSLGITILELHTRERPYNDNSSGAVEQRIRGEVVKGVRPPIPKDVPPSIAALIADCWSAEPSARPTCEEILRQLRTLEHELYELQQETEEESSMLAEFPPDDEQ